MIDSDNLDYDRLTIEAIDTLQEADAAGLEVVLPRPGSVLSQLRETLAEVRRLRDALLTIDGMARAARGSTAGLAYENVLAITRPLLAGAAADPAPTCPASVSGRCLESTEGWTPCPPGECDRVVDPAPTVRVGCITPDGTLMRGHFGPCSGAGHQPVYVTAADPAPTGDQT